MDSDVEISYLIREKQMQSKKNTLGYKIGKQNRIYEQRRKTCDYAFLLALGGILLMIIETELTINRFYDKSSLYSFCIKSLITLSTIGLLILILTYHVLELKAYMLNNSLSDWLIPLTCGKIITIFLELCVCSIHPIPGDFSYMWIIERDSSKQAAQVPVDLFLSLPMFLRLYLLFRVMLLHSNIFTDASGKSIQAFNRVKLNATFVVKTSMNLFPGTVILVVLFSFFIVSSWILRACENYFDENYANFLNTMYLVAITFLGVGYGDMVPHTYCGRSVCVLAGLLGVSCAAIVAVLSTKLQLSKDEKYAHDFMIGNELSKKIKHTAATLIKYAWLVHKNKNTSKLLECQIKLHCIIQSIRRAKTQHVRILDNVDTTNKDVYKLFQSLVSLRELVAQSFKCHEDFNRRLDNAEKQLQNIIDEFDNLPARIQEIYDNEMTMFF